MHVTFVAFIRELTVHIRGPAARIGIVERSRRKLDAVLLD